VRLAHLVPTACLPRLNSDQGVYLALSNLIVTDPGYRQFHCDKRDESRTATVILDNPVHERWGYESFVSALRILRPHIAVLPDTIASATLTVSSSRYYAGVVRNASPETLAMVVPHGRTDEEYVYCATEMVRTCQPAYIGMTLAGDFDNDAIAYEARRRRLQMLLEVPEIASACGFHFLGISETAAEFTDELTMRTVSSADASKFAVWHLSEQPVLPPSPINVPYPGRDKFGGSMAYFNYMPDLDQAAGLSHTLKSWSDYAKGWNPR
jgi:hypothetical protein